MSERRTHTPNLARLIAAQQALSAAIARVETPIKPPEPPVGMRWLIPPRHALTPNHEGDARTAEITLARMLFWRALLAHRQPTRESLIRAHGLLRGLAFKRLAELRRARAETPPLKLGAPSLPVSRVSGRSHTPFSTETETRAEGDNNPGDMSFEQNPELSADAGALLETWDYYDVWGDATDIPADELVDATQLPLSDEEKSAITEGITLENILTAFAQDLPGYSDLQIAQAIDAAWNGQAALWGGQSTFDAAGIAGTFDIRDPWFLDYPREQSGYWITGIDETTRQLVSQTLWDMLGGNPDLWAPAGSRGPDTIARWLQRWSNVYENDLAGMSYARAYMIAVTETARAETFGTFVSLWQTGARQKVWISTAGACVYCLTNTEEGPVDLTRAFPTGLQAPPQHPMCFPSGTSVFGPRAVGSTERWYAGPLVEMLTAGGHFLACTPNHPILTTKGWVAAGLLREGDHVVCGSFRERSHAPTLGIAGDPDEDQIPAFIEDVARTLGGASSVTATRVRQSASSFHGDGTPGAMTQVRIAHNGSSSSYCSGRDSSGRSSSHEGRPVIAAQCDQGTSPQTRQADRTTGTSRHRVGRRAASQPPLRTHLSDGRDGPHITVCESSYDCDTSGAALPSRALASGLAFSGLGQSTPPDGCHGSGRGVQVASPDAPHHMRRYSSERKAQSWRTATDAHNIDDTSPSFASLNTHAHGVHMDEVVLVSRREFSGNVYNLETAEGWYLAGAIPSVEGDGGNASPISTGIVVHNCRCGLGAYVPDTFNPDDWTPRPAGALEGLLGNWDGASWPMTDLSFLDDVELPGIELAAQPDTTRRRAAPKPRRRTVQPHPLAKDAFAALGAHVTLALESAGRAWLAALDLHEPRDIEGVQALLKRAQALPAERVRAADRAYLRRARQAVERAMRAL